MKLYRIAKVDLLFYEVGLNWKVMVLVGGAVVEVATWSAGTSSSDASVIYEPFSSVSTVLKSSAFEDFTPTEPSSSIYLHPNRANQMQAQGSSADSGIVVESGASVTNAVKYGGPMDTAKQVLRTARRVRSLFKGLFPTLTHGASADCRPKVQVQIIT
ncbi:hypothetical protein Tco_1289540 [Tanacetum coccineum]